METPAPIDGPQLDRTALAIGRVIASFPTQLIDLGTRSGTPPLGLLFLPLPSEFLRARQDFLLP